jgi:hypothetical protein
MLWKPEHSHLWISNLLQLLNLQLTDNMSEFFFLLTSSLLGNWPFVLLSFLLGWSHLFCPQDFDTIHSLNLSNWKAPARIGVLKCNQNQILMSHQLHSILEYKEHSVLSTMYLHLFMKENRGWSQIPFLTFCHSFVYPKTGSQMTICCMFCNQSLKRLWTKPRNTKTGW